MSRFYMPGAFQPWRPRLSSFANEHRVVSFDGSAMTLVFLKPGPTAA
jgi:hypothetical protein